MTPTFLPGERAHFWGVNPPPPLLRGRGFPTVLGVYRLFGYEMSIIVSYVSRKIYLNPGQNISKKLSFFCEIAPYGKGSISIFQEFFASIDKILILGARLSTRI